VDRTAACTEAAEMLASWVTCQIVLRIATRHCTQTNTTATLALSESDGHSSS
jgi:hypothetical protein